MSEPTPLGLQTIAIHAGEQPDPTTGASAPNLVMSTTFVAGCLAGLSAGPGAPQPADLRSVHRRDRWGLGRYPRVPRGHWNFEKADPAWRSLPYVAGGHFYAIGGPLDVIGAEDPDQED